MAPAAGFITTGLREVTYISQNALRGTVSSYDPDFRNGGWYKERVPYDFSSITVPMRSLFLKGDPVCPIELVNSNKDIIDSIPSHGKSVEINFEVISHFAIVGDNDPIMKGVRHGLLDVNAGETLAEDCSNIDFSDWN